MRELLAGRDREVHLLAHEPQRGRVERPDRVLVEEEPVGLERVAEVGGLRRAQHRVRVEEQVDVVAERVPERLGALERGHDRRLRVPARERGAEHPVAERGEPLLLPAQRVLDQLLRVVPPEVDVDADPVAGRAAEEARDGNAERLAFQIPEGDVDARDGAHHDLAGRPEHPAHHLAPPVLDLPGILSHEELAEVVEDAEHAAPLPGEARLADAREPFVGADEHDDDGELVVLAVPLAVAAAEGARRVRRRRRVVSRSR